jgi:hypothetical protein
MKLLLLINFLFFTVGFSQKKQSGLEKVITKNYTLEFDRNYFSRMEGYDQSVILFIKNPCKGYVESLKISVKDLSAYKKMDLEYFSELREDTLKDDYKILSKTKGESNGQKYIDLIYGRSTKMENFKAEFKNFERLYFHQSKIFKLFFNSSKNDYEKHFPKIEEALKSFTIK